VDTCNTTFKRRSNLTQHQKKKHHFSKEDARSTCIKVKPKMPSFISNGFYSDISHNYSDVSSDDEVLDLVQELYSYLDTYIPEDVSNTFIDDLLDATGNSTGDLQQSVNKTISQRRHLRR
jgi:hypothetical protein